MHIDKYVVNNIGTKWTKGKDKKNCILDSLDGIDGIEGVEVIEGDKVGRRCRRWAKVA